MDAPPQPPVGTAWHQATFPASFARFWRGYVVFRGRAARAEFWWWALWWAILSVAINIVYGIGILTMGFAPPSADEMSGVDQAMESFNPFPVWWFLLSSLPLFARLALGLFAAVSLVALVPWIAIAVRRLHDTNRSGWWVLLYLLPFGNVALFVFLALPSGPPADAGPRVGDRPAQTPPAPQ